MSSTLLPCFAKNWREAEFRRVPREAAVEAELVEFAGEYSLLLIFLILNWAGVAVPVFPVVALAFLRDSYVGLNGPCSCLRSKALASSSWLAASSFPRR